MMDLLDLHDIDIIDIDSDDEEIVRVPKRYIRDAQDPFEFYSEKEFKTRFRFDKDSVKYGILPEIEEILVKRNNRGLPIPPLLQLLICLRFYVTASFQIVLGDTISLSQPTVSRIIFRVNTGLARLIHQYVKMPTNPDVQAENRRLFRNVGFGNGAIGIPGVDGAIDCTHVRLVNTRFQNIDEIFRNTKGFFSLNVQVSDNYNLSFITTTRFCINMLNAFYAVVGPRMEFLDIVPEWPGSAHDSRIFQNSRIYMRYFERQLIGLLVSDAGYPCLPFLKTPIANPETVEETTYNNIHVRTRIIVERTFGV